MNGRWLQGHTQLMEPLPAYSQVNRLRIALAGPAAQERYDPCEYSHHASVGIADDYEIACKLCRELNGDFEYFEETAKMLILEHWAMVEVVARALFEKEVDELIGVANGPSQEITARAPVSY